MVLTTRPIRPERNVSPAHEKNAKPNPMPRIDWRVVSPPGRTHLHRQTHTQTHNNFPNVPVPLHSSVLHHTPHTHIHVQHPENIYNVFLAQLVAGLTLLHPVIRFSRRSDLLGSWHFVLIEKEGKGRRWLWVVRILPRDLSGCPAQLLLKIENFVVFIRGISKWFCF